MYRFLSCTLIILSLLQTDVLAAAWTQSKGSGQLITSLTAYQSSEFYNENGDTDSSGMVFTKLDLNPFIEYGLTDNVTIGISPSLQIWNFDKERSNDIIYDFRQCGLFNRSNSYQVNSQMFDVELFIRKKILDKNSFVLSLQPLVKTPCLIVANGTVRLIENSADLELRILGGYGFKWNPKIDLHVIKRPFAGQYHFVNVEVAYRKRNSRFSDQLKFDSTLGLRVTERLLFMGQIFSTFSTGDEAIRGEVGNNGLVFEKDDFYTVKAQIAAVQQITKQTSLQMSVFKEVDGKNSGAGSGVSIAIWYFF